MAENTAGSPGAFSETGSRPPSIEPGASAGAPRPRKPRGVRLTDLDRSRLWVIGHTGRRWETLGPLDELAAAGTALSPDPSAGSEVASTGPDFGAAAGRASSSPDVDA